MNTLKKINKTIEVEIDKKLSQSLIDHTSLFQLCGKNRIEFNLYDFMISIATLYPFRPLKANLTNRIKLQDYDFLLDWLLPGDELKILNSSDPDQKKLHSELFGLGTAVETTHRLFGIKRQTLGKIIRKGNIKTPDFECFSHIDKLIVAEAKGATNEATRKVQKKTALNQKNARKAHINIASCTLFNDKSIAHCDYLDPSLLSPKDPRYKELLLMADHYIRVFDLLGQKQLSQYFVLMRKRIKADKGFPEYLFKEQTLREIKQTYIKIDKNNQTYLGKVALLNHDKYLFVGLDKRLLFADSFLHYEEHKEPLDFLVGNNNEFHVSTDGICIGHIDNFNSMPQYFRENIVERRDKGEVKNFQEYTSLIDIDLMNGYALEKYISYLFEKEGFEFEIEKYINDYGHDFTITYKTKTFFIELKRFQRKNGSPRAYARGTIDLS